MKAAIYHGPKEALTGEDVDIEVSAGGEVVGSLMFEATSAQILSGLIDIGMLTTTLKASNVALGVTGSVVPEPGVAPAPIGSIVRVTNLSQPNLAPQDSPIGSAGPDAFTVERIEDPIHQNHEATS